MPTIRPAPLLALFALGVFAVACSGGSKEDPNTIVVKDRDITPVIATSELVTGPNRFVVGVLDKDEQPIVDAKVHFTFYDLNSGSAVKRMDMDAVSRVPARDSGLTEQVVHVHPDGTKHVHVNAGEDVGVYTTNVTFDKPGNWGVEIAVDSKQPKVKDSVRVQFNVLPESVTPAIGSPAPRSRNATLADVGGDINQIDSSASPAPELHQTTIADAIAGGKPALVLFAVPGFCESRLCGPEYEIMKKLYPSYAGKAEFIHVEFYKDPGNPERVPVDAVREWKLQTEPWFFVIDSHGIISAKFEGPTTLGELDEALQKVVNGS